MFGPLGSDRATEATNKPSVAQSGQASGPNSEWQTQRFERRKRIKEAVKDKSIVVGTKTENQLECGYDVRSIFVSNVNKKYSEKDMCEWIKEAGAECVRIRQISHKDATNKSFKVCVKAADYDKVMTPEFWGGGIRCRDWVK